MNDDRVALGEATEPAGEAAPPAASKPPRSRHLPVAEAEDQDRASPPDDEDVDIAVDKTDMSAVGDDGQVFGG
jgi:hypothetical protein